MGRLRLEIAIFEDRVLVRNAENLKRPLTPTLSPGFAGGEGWGEGGGCSRDGFLKPQRSIALCIASITAR